MEKLKTVLSSIKDKIGGSFKKSKDQHKEGSGIGFFNPKR